MDSRPSWFAQPRSIRAMSEDVTMNIRPDPTKGGASSSRAGSASVQPPAADASTDRGDLSITIHHPQSPVEPGLTAHDPGSGSLGRNTTPGGGLAGDDALPAGTRLGHFEIEARLGAGGMGQVYQALDRSLQRRVAVKVLRSRIDASQPDSEQEVDRLLQEAVSQARLPHPNVVPIYYVGKQDGSPFLAMELVAGQTLQRRLEQGQMPFPAIVSIGLQLAGALAFAHRLDLIHGDIKPSNILVQEDLLAKLSDFGMARRASGGATGPVGGTPNYLAPELLEGGVPNLQSDIYALGVTLYEMTFGERPLKLSGRTVQDWAKCHREAKLAFPAVWPESVPEDWRRVLRKMLAPHPRDRYTSYDELRVDLQGVLPAAGAPARWLPRIIAAVIDYSMILVVMLVLLAVFSVLETYKVSTSTGLDVLDQSTPWYLDMVLVGLGLLRFVVLLLPVAVHVGLVGYWRQSVGRELMHLHVVNRYGLPSSRRQMATRCILRTAPLWCLPLAMLVQGLIGSWIAVAGWIAFGLIALITFISATMLVVTPTGRPFHDRWLGTRMVFGTGK